MYTDLLLQCKKKAKPGAMVKATKGILVNCDAAIKEVLLQLDSSMHFIIEVLDSNHLFIEESQYERVQEMLQEKLSENVFKPPQ